MKSIATILYEAKDKRITTTKTGNVDIFETTINSGTKSKINKQLDKIYRSSMGTPLNTILDLVEKCLNDNGYTPIDEEYSAGWKSIDIPDKTDKEFAFSFGELNSIVDTGLGYKPVTKIVSNAEVRMFIFKENKKTKVESIYIS